MSNQTDNRTPEEIERDIERTRADFSSTVEALQNKLNPSELADQAVDYVMTTAPVAYSVDFVNTVRNNPIPVAMMGIGLAWFMSANRQAKEHASYSRQRRVVRHTVYPATAAVGYERTHHDTYSSGDSGDGVIRRASARVSETGRGLKDKVSETGRGLKDKASETGQRLSSSASEMTDRARQIRENAANRLHETAEQAQARASEMRRQAQVRASEIRRQAQARADALRQRSQEQYYLAKDRFGQMLDEQPLVVGALGIALGAALGAALPTTRRENDLLGQTRDDLLNRARETAREQAETVKQSAQRVAEVAKEEVARVAEMVKDEAAHVVEVAKERAGHVTDVAKEEAGHVGEAAKKQVRDQM